MVPLLVLGGCASFCYLRATPVRAGHGGLPIDLYRSCAHIWDMFKKVSVSSSQSIVVNINIAVKELAYFDEKIEFRR